MRKKVIYKRVTTKLSVRHFKFMRIGQLETKTSSSEFIRLALEKNLAHLTEETLLPEDFDYSPTIVVKPFLLPEQYNEIAQRFGQRKFWRVIATCIENLGKPMFDQSKYKGTYSATDSQKT